jgi:hypothetical protein
MKFLARKSFKPSEEKESILLRFLHVSPSFSTPAASSTPEFISEINKDVFRNR